MNIKIIVLAIALISIYPAFGQEFTDSDNDGFLSDVDCDDSDPAINPDADELFDGIDNNCDGNIDEGFTDSDNDGFPAEGGADCDDSDPAILGPTPFYRDSDNDGFGDNGISELACTIPPGFVDDNTDCDDNDSNTNPSASEVSGDSKDNNCNGLIDEVDLENEPIIQQILSQIQDILDSILGLDTRVTELEERVC